MIPREWYQRYGPAFPRIMTLQAAEEPIVAADYDRYLLAVYPITNGLFCYPHTGDVWSGGGHALTDTNPLILTHALHGAMVNLAWWIHNIGPNSQIWVVEARAAPAFDDREMNQRLDSLTAATERMLHRRRIRGR